MIQGVIQGALGAAEITGKVLGVMGADKAAHAAEEAAQEAALVFRERAAVQASIARRSARRARGYERAQVARSGMSLRGSAMDLMVSNAWEDELSAIMIERFGESAARQQYAQANSIARGATFARAAGIIDLSTTIGRNLAGSLPLGGAGGGGGSGGGGGGG